MYFVFHAEKYVIVPFYPQFHIRRNPSGKPDGIWQNEI